MSNYGMTFAQANFFDGFDDGGFLTIQTSGQTGTTGLALIRLTSVELSLENSTTDLQSFDSDFSVSRAITTQSFSLSCEGYFCGSGATANGYSGTTAYVSGALDGEEILDLALQRRTDLSIYIKVGNKIKTGEVVIASFSISSSVGEVQTYSLELQGNGGLTAV